MKKITLLILTLCFSAMSYAQFPESFDGGASIPAGWAVFPGANGLGTVESWQINDTNDYAFVIWEAVTAGQTAEDWIVTPQVAITSSNNLLTFDMTDFNAPDYGSEVTVRVSTDASQTNIAGFTDILLTIDELDTNGGAFQPWNVDLSAYIGSSIYVAFVMEGNDGDAWGLDNVDFTALPSCFDPNSFVLGPNGITTTSVDIAWTDPNGGGTVFDIEWGVEGFLPGLGTMVNDLAATSYEFTSLAPDTNYEFYITANCTGGNGDSSQVGPIGFTTAYDCSTFGLPYSEDFANQNAFTSCYSIEDANADTTSWGYNNGNDFDGDTVNDPVALIFPPDPTVAKDDWLFLPMAINGVANADYDVTVVYNVFNNPVTGSESFDIVVLDSPSSAAATQTVVGTYSGITQAGAGVADLLPNAYTSTATYTPAADGTFYIGIHATTPQATSAILTLFSIDVNETLGLNDFESNDFTYSYSKDLETLTLESSNLEMTNIEIYSILGQNVISKPLSSTREVIDIASLNDGVYLAKVFADGGSKTIKFVKN